VVQRRLGCRTPERVAALLAGAAERSGDEVPGRGASAALRVLDAGAGNGVSGDALAARGLDPVVGLDLEPAARAAALRDRPGRYGIYLTADLTDLAEADEAAIRAARPQALACVGSVGGDHLPPAAVVAGLRLLEPPALLAYAFDAGRGPDPLRDALAGAPVLARERYVHRRTVTGGERVWEAVVAQAGLRALPKSG
jgi:SAM-dependent methyltransferase